MAFNGVKGVSTQLDTKNSGFVILLIPRPVFNIVFLQSAAFVSSRVPLCVINGIVIY